VAALRDGGPGELAGLSAFRPPGAGPVRRLRPEEWRTWRELRLRALADAPAAFCETLAQARAQGDAGWQALAAPRPEVVPLIAERGGAPAGMVVAAIDAADPARAELHAMWVVPEARGAGLGGALVDAALRWTRGRAALELTLGVTEGNEAARALYEARGFRDTGERRPLREGAASELRVMALRQPPLVMGVVNVTPDSFSDGGRYLDAAAAIEHGLALLRDGADLLDVGGEATNPRAAPIEASEELRRVLPVIEALSAAGATVSIDTTKAAVARAAAAAGASIVNDVSGGLFDPAMPEALADLGDVTYIAGHLRGATLAEVFAPERAGAPPTWPEVARELEQRLAALPPEVRARAWADPGIGFGKGADPEANLDLLRHAGDLRRAVRRPVIVGPSRKRFLRRLVGGDPDAAALDAATIAACLGAVRGGAQVLRVHNVALLRAALAVYTKL
jgi:dihydropteroate synthase